ncbi:type II toxin-antitoxin system RelE/ParE family toxin [Devosia rhizoryzae]|uniref:type II toxin-antitoxin system RelE/ParE family toxin n=1 Tax=Devosia rhizoryzae TaxID=2774137 RepID=UPI001E56B768|nr:type II toxin-antitoxin system RelE/ParE family toxin [Devosia rhizoryzae]
MAHLDEIQDYVAQDSPSAAYRLSAELFRRTQALGASPMAGRLGTAVRHKRVRL